MRFLFLTLSTLTLTSPALAATYDAPKAAEVYCALRQRGVPQQEAFSQSLTASRLTNPEPEEPVAYNGKYYPRDLFLIFNAIHARCPYYIPRP